MTTLEQIELEPPVGNYLANLLDTAACADVVRLLPEQPMRRAPFFTSDPADPALAQFAPLFADRGFRGYAAAALSTCRLRNVRLLGSDAVLSYDGLLLKDTLNHITHWAPGSVVAEYRQAEYLRLRAPLRLARMIDGHCMIGFTASWRNYAHWMQETLPKLFMFRQIGRDDPSLRIVLPVFGARSFQQQTLDLLEIGPERIERVQDGEVVGFASVMLVSNVDLWGVPPVCRAAARDLATTAERAFPVGIALPPRVYIHRGTPPRQVANFAEIRACVERHGFTVVDFQTMRLAEQIATMREARLVIGEHGAGLVNLMFCPRGAQILELFNQACVQPEFWSLASACGLGFGYLVGSVAPSADQPASGWNSDYVVPVARLESAIAAMLTAAESALPV